MRAPARPGAGAARGAGLDVAARPVERAPVGASKLAASSASAGVAGAAGPFVKRRGRSAPSSSLASATACSSTKRVCSSPGRERRMRQQVAEERDVGRDALDAKLVEGAPCPCEDVGELRRAGVRDHLREQRVEARARRVARVGAGVDANAGAGRRIERRDHAARRPDGAVGVDGLGVDPRLEGEAARLGNLRLREPERRERRAAGEAELELHQVETRDGLGDRVLDLEPRVRLDEGERRVAAAGRVAAEMRGGVPSCSGFAAGVRGGVRVDQELEGAEAREAHLAREPEGGVGEAVAQARRKARGRRDLDELLVAALDAALALAEARDRAAAVADDLDLDVARPRHQALDVDVAVAEGGERLRPAALVGVVERRERRDDAHPAPAAAGDRLDHHRVARGERAEEAPGVLERRGAARTGQDGDAAALRERARLGLVAEQLERLRTRADERDARGRASAREIRALGEEAVAGVNRVAPGVVRDAHDLLGVEIRARPAAAERARLVGARDVQRARVVLGEDRDGLDPELDRGAHDPDRDLAAVRDQQALRRHRVEFFHAPTPGVQRPRRTATTDLRTVPADSRSISSTANPFRPAGRSLDAGDPGSPREPNTHLVRDAREPPSALAGEPRSHAGGASQRIAVEIVVLDATEARHVEAGPVPVHEESTIRRRVLADSGEHRAGGCRPESDGAPPAGWGRT